MSEAENGPAPGASRGRAKVGNGKRAMRHVRLDLGKHNGRRVQDVPTGYLRWCLRECECLTPRQRQAVAEELARRDAGRHPGPPPGLETDYPPPVDWSPLIRRWHRE